MRSGSPQRGFTYVTALLMVAAVSAGTASFAEQWSHARQREREAQLLWIGNQFRHAIGLYYERSPGNTKRFPERLEDLLEDKRFLTTQRYLRRIYSDPLTGQPDWQLIVSPTGGIMGLTSAARGKPLLRPDALSYAEIAFVYTPILPRPPSGR